MGQPANPLRLGSGCSGVPSGLRPDRFEVRRSTSRGSPSASLARPHPATPAPYGPVQPPLAPFARFAPPQRHKDPLRRPTDPAPTTPDAVPPPNAHSPEQATVTHYVG